MKERHSLVRPVTPGQVITTAMRKSGRELDTICHLSGIRLKRLRKICADKQLPSKREIRGLSVACSRWHVAFEIEIAAAEQACREWDEREARLAKERGQ